MGAAVLLDRLHGVRKTGRGRWLAKCPAHNDRSPSLSIRELDDGRLLLHDFGGCGTDDVLAAIDLTMTALFPDGSRGDFKSTGKVIPAGDVLLSVSHELDVAVLLIAKMLGERILAEDDWTRLTQAAARIRMARAHVN